MPVYFLCTVFLLFNETIQEEIKGEKKTKDASDRFYHNPKKGHKEANELAKVGI